MPSTSPEPIVRLELPIRLSSWNQILAMEHWARYKHKQELAKVFLSALRATAGGSSTLTTSARSTLSIYADTLESYLTTALNKRKLRSAKSRAKQKK